MPETNTLYQKTVKISEDFLGPAGERFIRRQITTHLQIEPEQLEKKHLSELAEWLHAAFAVLTRDVSHVNAYVERIIELGGASTKHSSEAGHGTIN